MRNKKKLSIVLLIFFGINFSQDRRVITTAVPFLMISAGYFQVHFQLAL